MHFSMAIWQKWFTWINLQASNILSFLIIFVSSNAPYMALNRRLTSGFPASLLCWCNSGLLAVRQIFHSLCTLEPLAPYTSFFMLMILSSLVLMMLLLQISFSGCTRNSISLILALSVFFRHWSYLWWYRTLSHSTQMHCWPSHKIQNGWCQVVFHSNVHHCGIDNHWYCTFWWSYPV